MKLRAMVMVGVMAITVLASARVATAQSRMVVNVPFAFAVGNTNLPAGEYSVKASEASRTLLLINRSNPEASVVITADAAEALDIQTRSKLVFHHYGDRYFLSQVWLEGSSRGKQLSRTDREKETAVAAEIEAFEQVVIAANR